MTERMDRLPPQARSVIARRIAAHRPDGVVTLTTIFDAVRAICPESVSDRAVEDAIAEYAVHAGLAVHFDHPDARTSEDQQPLHGEA